MEWLFSCEYWLLLVSKCCFGISIFLIIDIIFQSGLLGFNLKEKWIRFLNNNFSTHIIVGFFIYLSFNYPFELFSTAYAMSEDETAKATIEVSNVKISNLDQAIKYGAGAGVFSTLFASTTKLVKTSSLPLGGKIAAGLGTSVVGLMTYKVLQENTYTTKPKGQIIIEADNVNSSTSIYLGRSVFIIVTGVTTFQKCGCSTTNPGEDTNIFWGGYGYQSGGGYG